MAHRQSGPGDSPRPAGLKIRFGQEALEFFEILDWGKGQRFCGIHAIPWNNKVMLSDDV
jgi:hypothetical protein